MDGDKLEEDIEKVLYYHIIYFNILFPVPTEVIPGVCDFSYLFHNHKVRFYGID
jgi:hypothetical protein